MAWSTARFSNAGAFNASGSGCASLEAPHSRRARGACVLAEKKIRETLAIYLDGANNQGLRAGLLRISLLPTKGVSMSKGKIWFALAVLFAINLLNFYDRLILGAVGESVRKDWSLNDQQLGWLGTAFILLYAAIGVPLGRWADRGNRSRILTGGITVWSILTAFSGMAQNFWQMVGLRLAVGVGEATCAPASNSLIGDLFPARTRARALSIFMLGLPIGNALCFLVSGFIAQRYGWRFAFYVALGPGLLCALGAYMLHEPARGATELTNIGAKKRDGNPYLLVLGTPTMLWIIVSGALHNFNMYAIGGFLTPYMMRVHGANVEFAGYISTAVYGLCGIPGMIVGGMLGDAVIRRWRNGRLLVASAAIALAVPAFYFALRQPVGDVAFLGFTMAGWLSFSLLFGFGCMLLYTYYATVYSTIQDVIEPSLRATAMALYFCAMYAFGGAAGPVVTGYLSEHFTQSAATAAGVDFQNLEGAERQKALEPYRGTGISSAMYVLPILGAVLAVSLFLGATTVKRDVDKLHRWMRETAEAETPAPPRKKVPTA
jgi:MFS family permease